MYTYEEFINKIILERGQWNEELTYWEGHHIIPRCLGGKGKSKEKHPNIIRLTFEEHYQAHILLAEKYPSNYNIISSVVFFEKLLLKGDKSKYIEKLKSFKWFTNGKEDVRLPKDKCPDGWWEGRKDSFKDNLSKAEKGKKVGLKGELNGMYGKKHTKEWKELISNLTKNRRWYNNGYKEVYINVDEGCPDGFVKGRLKNNKHYYTNGEITIFSESCPIGFYLGIPEERKQKISISAKKNYKKRIVSEETKKRISEKTRGKRKNRIQPAYNCVMVRCIETGKVYKSISDACRDTGATGISDCLNGKLKTSKKLHWEKIENDSLMKVKDEQKY